jgi:hypothetical protein
MNTKQLPNYHLSRGKNTLSDLLCQDFRRFEDAGFVWKDAWLVQEDVRMLGEDVRMVGG